jgi:hypothetical protein
MEEYFRYNHSYHTPPKLHIVILVPRVVEEQLYLLHAVHPMMSFAQPAVQVNIQQDQGFTFVKIAWLDFIPTLHPLPVMPV